MNELIVIFSLFFMVCCGYSLLVFFNFLSDHNFFEKIPYSFGLGVGLIAFQLFTYSRISIEWNRFTILIPWIVIIAYAVIKNNKRIKGELFPVGRFKLSLQEVVLIILNLIALGYTAFEVWLRPLYAWDGWAIWLIKSKMFFIDGHVDRSVYAILKDSYPYVINLVAAFIYEMLGSVDDRTVLLLFFCFYLFLGISFFNFSKKHLGVTYALLFTFLLISIQNVIRHGGRFEAGYADLALGYYIFLSTTLFMNYLRNRKTQDLVLCSIFLSITGLIKEEGLLFCIALQSIAFYFLIIKEVNVRRFLILLLWTLPILDWNVFKFINGINYSLYQSQVVHLDRIPVIVLEFLNELLRVQNWNILWLAFFVGVISFLVNRKDNRYSGIILIIIIIQLVSYVFVFAISPYDPPTHVGGVLNRLLLHIVPLAVFFIGYVFMLHKNYD